MILRLILWYLDRRYHFVYNDIDEKSMNEWLKNQNAEHGFRDYFKIRDLTILKTLGNGLTQKQYWINVGRRIELLFLLGKAAEKIKKKDKKRDQQDG